MRRLLIYAFILAAAWALSAARLGSVPVPGVGVLHRVEQLLRCNAGALHDLTADPAAVGESRCASVAATLTGGSGNTGTRPGAGVAVPAAPPSG